MLYGSFISAVNLKEIQNVNKALDKQKNILQVAGVYYDGIDVQKTFSSFQPAVVDLNTGNLLTNLILYHLMIKKALKILFLVYR